MEDLWRTLAVVLAIYLALIIALVVSGRGALAREVATLLPNLLLLFRGLVADPRVGRGAKMALVLATLWIASPIDLIPEFIPVAGPLDDAIVAALVLRYVLQRTERAVLYEHWRGNQQMLDRLLALARV